MPAAANDPVQGRRRLLRKHFPESAIDEFTRIDNGVEFYTRVNALLLPGMTVVDYGAGRGQWYYTSESQTFRRLKDLRGKVARVIGVDIDSAVTTNPTLDEAHVLAPNAGFPFDDDSIDMFVSDWTFEHIGDPPLIGAELLRVLRPGGWVCARTPNKRGYIGLASRLIPNQWHVSWLTKLQPNRRDIDVFPVRYKLNTPRDIARAFPSTSWERIIYTLPSSPAYAGVSPVLWALFRVVSHLEPRALDPVLAIFLRKRASASIR